MSSASPSSHGGSRAALPQRRGGHATGQGGAVQRSGGILNPIAQGDRKRKQGKQFDFTEQFSPDEKAYRHLLFEQEMADRGILGSAAATSTDAGSADLEKKKKQVGGRRVKFV